MSPTLTEVIAVTLAPSWGEGRLNVLTPAVALVVDGDVAEVAGPVLVADALSVEENAVGVVPRANGEPVFLTGDYGCIGLVVGASISIPHAYSVQRTPTNGYGHSHFPFTNVPLLSHRLPGMTWCW